MAFYPADNPLLAYQKHHPGYVPSRHDYQLCDVIKHLIGCQQLLYDEIERRVLASYEPEHKPRVIGISAEFDYLVRMGDIVRTKYGFYKVAPELLDSVLRSSPWDTASSGIWFARR